MPSHMLQCLQSHMIPDLDPDYNHNKVANVDARLTWESSSSGTLAVVHVEAQEIDSDLLQEVERRRQYYQRWSSIQTRSSVQT